MKKILFLLVVLLTGCKPTCILSQVSNQFIAPGVNCTAVLPDYTLLIRGKANCSVPVTTQIPLPGLILTNLNTPLTVTVKATTANGGSNQVVFTVSLAPEKPTFIIDPSLTYTFDSIQNAYNKADRMVATMMQKQGLIRPMGLYNKADSTLYFKMEGTYSVVAYPRPYIDYYKNTAMLIYTSPGYALTGRGHRSFQFILPKDSCKVLNKIN